MFMQENIHPVGRCNEIAHYVVMECPRNEECVNSDNSKHSNLDKSEIIHGK
jgi:hypothetical protein